MSPSSGPVEARSWLFAPGDSERKMAKALDSTTDIVLLDLEDSVATDAKPRAREAVRQFILAHADATDRLWVRINPLAGPHALADLGAIIAAGPGGIMLPKPRGGADLHRLDHYITALEAAYGIAPGSVRIIVVATETPSSLLTIEGYRGCARLGAMTWGAEDLATALGASSNLDPAGGYASPYRLARDLCLVGAAAAAVAAIETIHGNYRDDAGLARIAEAARIAGFRGMMAIHPAQIDIINAAFTPSPAETDRARAIIAAFEADPAAGTIGLDGEMLDLPHLARARAVLARLER